MSYVNEDMLNYGKCVFVPRKAITTFSFVIKLSFMNVGSVYRVGIVFMCVRSSL